MPSVKKTPARPLDPARWQREHATKSVSLSDTQYSMALTIEGMRSRIIQREELDILFGPTVNSFLARGYLKQHSETAVYWTKAGSDAIRRHNSAEIHRKPTGRFSAYLNLASYDDKPPRSAPPPALSDKMAS